MKFRFSWLNARKNLIFASFFDFSIFNVFFLVTFINSITSNSILIFLCLVNSLIWIISSYIIGRYSYTKRGGVNIFINSFFKTLLNILLNIFFTQFLFRILWNWNYMNFESFSNFLNDFSSFYTKVFILTFFAQYFISSHSYKKTQTKSIWLFLGSLERQRYLKELIYLSSRFKIILFDQKYLSKPKFNCKV